MIWNVNNTPVPAWVLDRHGCEIELCVECDTDTGRTFCYKTERGEIVRMGGALVVVESMHPAPLQIVWRNNAKNS